MSFQVVASGGGRQSLLAHLGTELRAVRPRALGIASAYVSVFGVAELKRLIRVAGSRECRLIAGIDGEITHPTSLRMALDAGWSVRVGAGGNGIFHPKLIIGGGRFSADGHIADPSCLYVGSGNMTRGGLVENVECGILSRDADGVTDYAESFLGLWRAGHDLTTAMLRDYSARFAKRNRARNPRDLAFVEVADYPQRLSISPTQLHAQAAPTIIERAIETEYATVAWAGLQSFTGEYQFQIEFPRAAGEVVQRLAGNRSGGQRVDVDCEDGTIQSMNFHFYTDNSMFRLNVPFDVPGVVWARRNRDGIAVITRGRRGVAPIRLQILKPSPQMNDVIAKSVALGTWGKTSTRLYGWM